MPPSVTECFSVKEFQAWAPCVGFPDDSAKELITMGKAIEKLLGKSLRKVPGTPRWVVKAFSKATVCIGLVGGDWGVFLRSNTAPSEALSRATQWLAATIESGMGMTKH